MATTATESAKYANLAKELIDKEDDDQMFELTVRFPEYPQPSFASAGDVADAEVFVVKESGGKMASPVGMNTKMADHPDLSMTIAKMKYDLPPPAPPGPPSHNSGYVKTPPATPTSSYPTDAPFAPIRLSKEGIAVTAFNYQKPILGKGGFSVVHQGAFYGKPAAVKMLTLRNDHELKMFEQELRAMLNPVLLHPNICPLLAYCKEQPAFVFPKLTAVTVERMTRLPDDVKDTICVDVANGLWHLHKQGFVHMDMKPDNVLLLFDDQRHIQKALVGDLGCVKSTSVPVLPYGTIVFLDPQIDFNQPRKPHPADDVYSLGLTFLSLWTNRIPTMREEIPHLLALLKFTDMFRYTMVKSMLSLDPMQRPTTGYIRDVLRSRLRRLQKMNGYPWSTAIPPISEPPFIGENAAVNASKFGFRYSTPVAMTNLENMVKAAPIPSNMIPSSFVDRVNGHTGPAQYTSVRKIGLSQMAQAPSAYAPTFAGGLHAQPNSPVTVGNVRCVEKGADVIPSMQTYASGRTNQPLTPQQQETIRQAALQSIFNRPQEGMTMQQYLQKQQEEQQRKTELGRYGKFK